MKFKKILSAALAAVMAASVMSVGMISSVSAEQKTLVWSYEKDPTIPAEFGFVDSTGTPTLKTTITTENDGIVTMGSSRTGKFNKPIFDDGTNDCFAGKTGYNIQKQNSSDAVKSDGTLYGLKYAGFTPTKTGTIDFYITVDDSNAKTNSIRFFKSTPSEVDGTKYVLDGTAISQHDLPGRDAPDPMSPISLEVTAGTRYYIYANNKDILFHMEFTYDDVAGGSSNSIAIAPTKDGKYVFVGIDDPDDPAIGTQIDVTIQNAEGKTATLDPITAVYQSLADTSIVNPLSKPYFFAYAVENADPKYSISASAGDLSASVEITESTTAAPATGTTAPQEPDPQSTTNGNTETNSEVTTGTYDFKLGSSGDFYDAYQAGDTKNHTFDYAGFHIEGAHGVDSSGIKLRQGEGSITFKVAQNSTMVINSTGKPETYKLILTGDDGSSVDITIGSIDPIPLKAGVTYTITTDATSGTSTDITGITITAQ